MSGPAGPAGRGPAQQGCQRRSQANPRPAPAAPASPGLGTERSPRPGRRRRRRERPQARPEARRSPLAPLPPDAAWWEGAGIGALEGPGSGPGSEPGPSATGLGRPLFAVRLCCTGSTALAGPPGAPLPSVRSWGAGSPLQMAHEGAGASKEADVATRGHQAPLSAELRSPAEVRMEVLASRPARRLQPAWPWTGQPPALGSSPVRRDGGTAGLLGLCLSNHQSISVEWAWKSSCLMGLRGLNGIKDKEGRIWCLPSTQKWLSL